jgi:hypothetical protein
MTSCCDGGGWSCGGGGRGREGGGGGGEGGEGGGGGVSPAVLLKTTLVDFGSMRKISSLLLFVGVDKGDDDIIGDIGNRGLTGDGLDF